MAEIPDQRLMMIVEARSWACAIRLEDAIEIMRPLPIDPVAAAPPFVRGVAIIRGEAIPVIDLGVLLGAAPGPRGTRFVTLRAGARRVAVEVDAVRGVGRVDVAALDAAPPLLSGALDEHVEAIGVLDGRVLAVLSGARLVPEGAAWVPAAEGRP